MPGIEKTLLPMVNAGTIKRLAVASLLASTVAACSSDTMRFGDNPFSNPFNETRVADTNPTGSIGYSPTLPVQSAPLAPPQQAAYPTSQPAVMHTTQAVEAVSGSAKGWSAQGGSAVYVGTGDTLATLSGRYNVPTAAILAANGMTNPSQIAPGQKLVIPVYNPAGSTMPVATAATPTSASYPVATAGKAPMQAAAPMPPAMAKPVQRVETAGVSLNEQASRISKANAPLAPQAPARQVVAALPPATEAALPKPVEQKAAVAVAPTPTKPAQPVAEQAAASEKSAATEEKAGFRWPARGRVINGFGSGNEGINIAVPEGTPVKAAEGGVVAYAGNELKGYGNLVLIRHENGWVSAYANNGELNVKRGETVARGQTIAKSGQTGNVTSPQLHFELRKGSKPVDPLPHLAGL
ncbi:peptidoglycan DD-metalloendopeptidase family protein [Pseudochelatococcus sp. G4_1912]|uniref:peptidoglycan DD-metalloendopeptidase family protein n=1 Tax=Pseudochelatococcus sp. G4_1912 TaxID=3114288 RepID=UPI0039C6F7DA